ncbi:MAG TPA: septum formation initiator family protein [Candidatus Acidoferrales bacterium]|nr:septum formation initiator family protein [Candidatus Acidoferrales bacterium]
MAKLNSKTRAKTKSEETRSFWSRYARYILALGLLLIAMHDVFGSHGLLAMHRTQAQVKQLRSEIDRLHQENSELTQEVKALRTDPKAVERIAREEMGLARPGEMIFKLPEQAQPLQPAAKTP